MSFPCSGIDEGVEGAGDRGECVATLYDINLWEFCGVWRCAFDAHASALPSDGVSSVRDGVCLSR
jgi:hypothetical protein